MRNFGIGINDNSVWVTSTPFDGAVSMPFYVTEIGHFYTGKDYITDRDGHNSYMLLYTVSGCGYIQTGDFCNEIKEGEAVIFNCRTPHVYKCLGERWDFFWIHIDGTGVEGMVNAINYNGIRIVGIKNDDAFKMKIQQIINKAHDNDIRTVSEISTNMHIILDMMIEDSLNADSGYIGNSHAEEIHRAVEFIERNFDRQIKIEDITNAVHISKFYFIRLFKQYMGMTPYSYLINYRINKSKIMLRTEEISVSEISRKSGFSDVSNFITQFKKQTGQKPMDYRKRFTL